MTGPAGAPAPRSPRPPVRRVAVEALWVAGIGVLVALLANAVSPRGLSLTRDYFPAAPRERDPRPPAPPSPGPSDPVAPGVTGVPATTSAPPTATPSAAGADPAAAPGLTGEEIRRRLQARGLKAVDGDEARRVYDDPRRAQEVWVFVDARNEAHFAEGHVPGAYLFDRYYPEKHLPLVLPACQQAERILVYCNGGECEDSELAAAALVEAGVPGDRVEVYLGGYTDWGRRRNPVESGARGSGEIREGRP